MIKYQNTIKSPTSLSPGFESHSYRDKILKTAFIQLNKLMDVKEKSDVLGTV